MIWWSWETQERDGNVDVQRILFLKDNLVDFRTTYWKEWTSFLKMFLSKTSVVTSTILWASALALIPPKKKLCRGNWHVEGTDTTDRRQFETRDRLHFLGILTSDTNCYLDLSQCWAPHDHMIHIMRRDPGLLLCLEGKTRCWRRGQGADWKTTLEIGSLG